MFSRRIVPLLLAMPILISGISNAQAEQAVGQRRHHHEHGQRDKSFYGGDGLPTYIRGVGTYAGGMSGVRDRGNGIYFAIEGQGLRQRDIDNSSKPRLIHVNRSTLDSACSREAGVCVIRP